MTVHFNSCKKEMYSLFKNELFQLHMNPLWLISIVLVTNCTPLVFGVKCVLVHTMLVTYTLMSVQVDIQKIFRRLKVPYNKYRRFINIVT